MSLDDAIERFRTDKDALNKWVGVYIGVLAVLLAICNVGGANEEHPSQLDQSGG